MPIRRHLYPDNWPEISLQVRENAGWCCEWCQAPNKTVIQRKPVRTMPDWVEVLFVHETTGAYESTEKMIWKRLKFHGLTRIILTTAHLDRDPGNNELDNLAALCQRCHLRYDLYQNIRSRRFGRGHDEQPKLF